MKIVLNCTSSQLLFLPREENRVSLSSALGLVVLFHFRHYISFPLSAILNSAFTGKLVSVRKQVAHSLGMDTLCSYRNFSKGSIRKKAVPKESIHFLPQSFFLSRHSNVGNCGEKELAFYGKDGTE